MGRLKDLLYSPYQGQRYKGVTVPELDWVTAGLTGDFITARTTPSLITPVPTVEKVAVDNGYYAQLMQRQMGAIDITDQWTWDPDTLSTGPVTILSKVVPDGLAWHIDNMYFFASALGGPLGTVLLGPAVFNLVLLMKVATSSSQLNYENSARLFPALPKSSFPFLNDRIGPREGKFGITLYGGEYIRATVEQAVAGVLPAAAVSTIGFRIMGIEAAKNDMQDYLELKRWDGTVT